MPQPVSPKPAPSTVTACRLPIAHGILALAACYRDQRFSRHAHEGYALGVIEAGALAFRYRGSKVVAPAGTVNLVQPDVPHDGEAAVPEGWRYRMLYLPQSALDMVLPEGAAAPNFRPGVLEDPRLAALVGRTHRLLMDHGASLLAKETGLLALFAVWIKRHADDHPAAPGVGREPRAVRMVLDLLAARFSENPTLGELATAVGLSPWHLTRVVTTHTGLPPHAHLLKYRLRAARDKLAGPWRLADIAAAVGFADQSHFTRAFRSRFGLSPGAYRKIVQNSNEAGT